MKEEEIRPRKLFEDYLKLCFRDAQDIAKEELVSVVCPACTSDRSFEKLSKNGFTYHLCRVCGSLYCNPRPPQEILENFYTKSESSKFWAEEFFPAIIEARREKLFRPKARKIYELSKKLNVSPTSICDVGAGYGILLEELATYFPDAQLCAIEPSNELATVCENKGFATLRASAEKAFEWKERFGFVVSSEVIEHVYDSLFFVHSLANLLQPGGVLLLTGLGYEGFDILTLQEKSNSIFPPHHLNFLSINGFEALFKKAGLIDIEIFTPGKLDVDIVLKSSAGSEFVRILALRGQEAMEEFQEFLVRHRLSSHVWCLGRKR